MIGKMGRNSFSAVGSLFSDSLLGITLLCCWNWVQDNAINDVKSPRVINPSPITLMVTLIIPVLLIDWSKSIHAHKAISTEVNKVIIQ
jgi:hypothetical protein